MNNPTPANPRRTVLCVAVIFLLAGCATQRTLMVESTPQGATVVLDGSRLSGGTPRKIEKLNFSKSESHRIGVEKENYQPQQRFLSLEQALTEAKSASQPWVVSFRLEEIRREIPVQVEANVEGFTVSVNGAAVASPTAAQTLVFTRAPGSEEWSRVAVRVEKAPTHKAKEMRLSPDDAERLAKTAAGVGRLAMQLDEIRREVSVEFKSNVEKAEVLLGENKLGETPLKATLIFTRADAASPWNTAQIKVQKEGYEYRAGAAAATPAFVRALQPDEAAKGIVADAFVPVKYCLTPVRSFEVAADKLTVKTNQIWATVDTQPDKVTKVPAQASSLIVSRFAMMPGGDKFVLAVPKWEAVAGGVPELVGANLVMVQAATGALTPLTSGRDFAIDPFVSKDGKYVYYSSDRQGTRSIWRIPAGTQVSFTRMTGTGESIDTEPAVSPDPDNQRLAYTSRRIGAPSTSPSYIWIANGDGTLPTQVKEGRSPAWSEDGKKVVFVSPEGRISTMKWDGTEATELTTREEQCAYPIWIGKYIVYVSNQVLNDQKERNLDLFIMRDDGSEKAQQLTANGSFDTAPASVPDAKTPNVLYFFSNREARQRGDDSLRVFQMEFKPPTL
jgi:hypothetical protein